VQEKGTPQFDQNDYFKKLKKSQLAKFIFLNHIVVLARKFESQTLEKSGVA
jgi:Rad3-related DNA helicase